MRRTGPPAGLIRPPASCRSDPSATDEDFTPASFMAARPSQLWIKTDPCSQTRCRHHFETTEDSHNYTNSRCDPQGAAAGGAGARNRPQVCMELQSHNYAHTHQDQYRKTQHAASITQLHTHTPVPIHRNTTQQ